MNRALFLITITCLLLSCKTDTSTTTNSTEVVKTSKASSPISQKERNLFLLQGKWRSLDDAGVYIEFEGNTRTEYTENTKEKIIHYFDISDQCNNDTKGNTNTINVPDKYISFNDIDMCYYIIKITPKELELSYVGRGNTLKYKKVN